MTIDELATTDNQPLTTEQEINKVSTLLRKPEIAMLPYVSGSFAAGIYTSLATGSGLIGLATSTSLFMLSYIAEKDSLRTRLYKIIHQ